MPGPVIGWKFQDVEIMRRAGESDDGLMQRAIETVAPTLRAGSVPSFFAIY